MSEQRERSFETQAISWLVLIIAIGAFAVFVWPNYYRDYRIQKRNRCIYTLRWIDAAAHQFVLEKGLTNGQSIIFPNDLTPYIKLNSAGKIPPCPNGGIYNISKVGKTPTCSMSTLTPAHVLP